MKTKVFYTALGRLMSAMPDLEAQRGGKPKVQKILGEDLYFCIGRRWFINTQLLNYKTTAQLNAYTKQIKAATK